MARSLSFPAAALVLGVSMQSCTSGITHADSAFAGAATSDSRAEGRYVEIENERFHFVYSYPSEAVEFPAVRVFLDQDLSASQTQLVQQASEAKADADKEGYPHRPHYLAVGWDVAADLSGWLSLRAEVETYAGGAHGNHGFTSLLFDKKANTKREPISLFLSNDAFVSAIRTPFCNALNVERGERRGKALSPDSWSSDDSFEACIDPEDGVVLLDSEDGEAFDRITILVAPYLAGPYAEGSYEIAVPVTAAIRSAVLPEFRDAFAVHH